MKRCTGERCVLQAGKVDPAKCQAVNVCENATPEESLEPCPHCGSSMVRVVSAHCKPAIYCACCMTIFSMDSVTASKEQLITAWNRRL